MKNNAIMFMIDSVTWESVGTNRCKVSPTPFLDSLKKEGLWTTNLYSHGPYTDAATRSLYTGRNTLDDFGYFFKLNASPTNHYKSFHDAGYETLSYYYPYYMMGNNVTKYIDKLYYKTGFEYRSEWGGVFNYYSDIRKQRELNNVEYTMVKARLELMFEVWLNFYNDLSEKPEASLNLQDLLSKCDWRNDWKILVGEYTKYNENQREYIDDFLKKGLEHTIAQIDYININDRIDRDYLNSIYKKHRSFFNRLEWNNILANIFSTLPSPKRVLHSISRYVKTQDKTNFTYLENYFLGLFHMRSVKAHWGGNRWQHMPSTRFMLDFASKEIIPNRDKTKPFFMCVNLEEVHHECAFFTYDIHDDKMIDEEIEMLNDYMKQLGSDFKGSLVYYLGLRYTDYCLEKFCNMLKEQGLWDNTSILFTADHGSSYTFYPVHNQRVNNFYDECYHIPVLIRHPGFAPKEVSTYQYSKDVLPTFLDMLGLPLSKHFKGVSMIRNTKPREYVLHEYMGPGCPDIMQRRIWFSIRDKKYVVAYKVGLYEKFEEGELCEVYDISKDPKCYYDLSHSIDRSKIEYLLSHIQDRLNEMKADSKTYYQKLKESDNIVIVNQ